MIQRNSSKTSQEKGFLEEEEVTKQNEGTMSQKGRGATGLKNERFSQEKQNRLKTKQSPTTPLRAGPALKTPVAPT